MHEYPSLTFRLNKKHLEQLQVISAVKHRSRGQVIRDAIEMYYRIVVRPVGAVGQNQQIVSPIDLLADLLPKQAESGRVNFD
jgi:hypothetical protein